MALVNLPGSVCGDLGACPLPSLFPKNAVYYFSEHLKKKKRKEKSVASGSARAERIDLAFWVQCWADQDLLCLWRIEPRGEVEFCLGS